MANDQRMREPPPHAVLFDIDGTLLDSSAIDGELYVDAVRQVLGEVKLRAKWSHYEHVTDRGILRGILTDNDIDLRAGRVEEIRACFVEALRHRLRRSGPLPEIPGARAFLTELSQQPAVHCAYATGGWGASAQLKLKSAGFPVCGLPLASCDDAVERVTIMKHALGQLGPGFASITYFGDGEWDRQATRALGWRFEAVGPELGGRLGYPNSAKSYAATHLLR